MTERSRKLHRRVQQPDLSGGGSGGIPLTVPRQSLGPRGAAPVEPARLAKTGSPEGKALWPPWSGPAEQPRWSRPLRRGGLLQARVWAEPTSAGPDPAVLLNGHRPERATASESPRCQSRRGTWSRQATPGGEPATRPLARPCRAYPARSDSDRVYWSGGRERSDHPSTARASRL